MTERARHAQRTTSAATERELRAMLGHAPLGLCRCGAVHTREVEGCAVRRYTLCWRPLGGASWAAVHYAVSQGGVCGLAYEYGPLHRAQCRAQRASIDCPRWSLSLVCRGVAEVVRGVGT